MSIAFVPSAPWHFTPRSLLHRSHRNNGAQKVDLLYIGGTMRLSLPHPLPTCAATGLLLLAASQPVYAQDTMTVACNGDPITGTYCYTDNDAHAWQWQSECGNPLTLHFLSGTIEASPNDHLRIYDGWDNTAVLLYMNGAQETDLAGMTFIGSAGSLYMEMTSNDTNCCATTGGFRTATEWQWTAASGSGTVGVGEALQHNIVLYPNPASGIARVHMGDHNGLPVQVRILDLTGRTVYSDGSTAGGDGTIALDLHRLPNGLYSVVLSGPGGMWQQGLQVIH